MITVSIVVFSRVNDKHSYNSKILINSISYLLQNSLIKKIFVIDNSPNKNFIWLETLFLNQSFKYLFTGENLGYGKGHNFIRNNLLPEKYHLILNPDIIFDHSDNIINRLFEFMESNNLVSMCQPLLLNSKTRDIQFLCKQNPTLFIQILRGFFPLLLKFPFKKYNYWYEMRAQAYSVSNVESEYLSGSFMFCKRDSLDKVNWFDNDFFMYLEDADLTRRLSRLGPCVHVPTIAVEHLWNRGSHKEWSLKFEAIKSFFTYSRKWGLKLF